MRTRRFLVALVVVLMVGALLPAGAFAGFTNSRGTSADAWWSSWDWSAGEPGPDDAISEWNISGWNGSGIFKDAGMPLDVFKSSMGYASMYSYTPATDGEPQMWAEFSCFAEPPSVLVFGRNLVTAKLEFMAEGTLNVWKDSEPWIEVGPDEWTMRDPDESTTEMVSVVANWRAAGPLTRSSWISRERTDDYFWADRSSQTYRMATAEATVVGASGTVYFEPEMLNLEGAQITSSKSNGRFGGEMPY